MKQKKSAKKGKQQAEAEGGLEPGEAEDDVVFQNTSLSVVKNWLHQGQEKECDYKTKNPEENVSLEDSYAFGSRLGLGASLSAKEKLMEEKEEALHKQFCKKRKRLQQLADEEAVQEHGVSVHGDEEESRIQAVSKKRPDKKESSNLIDDKNAYQQTQTKKKKKKNKNKNKAQPPTKEGEQADSNEEVSKVERKDKHKETTKPSPNRESQPQDMVEFDDGLYSTGRSRKKKKTRSKQKNIRKDRRTADQRPAHLQYGKQEFSGRALTKETMEKLSLHNVKDIPVKESYSWAVALTSGQQQQPNLVGSNKNGKKRGNIKNKSTIW